MRETREKNNGDGKTPHLSNVGMAGQAGEKVVSPDGVCVSQESGAKEQSLVWLMLKLEKKGSGAKRSRVHKKTHRPDRTPDESPEIGGVKSKSDHLQSIVLHTCCFRLRLILYGNTFVVKEAENEALFLTAPHYRAVVNRPVWITLVSFKNAYNNLACYYYSTLSSIRLKENGERILSYVLALASHTPSSINRNAFIIFPDYCNNF
jgi:hypothetical protein